MAAHRCVGACRSRLSSRCLPSSGSPSPSRRKPIQMPGLHDIAERISRSYDTRVMVSLGKRKGKIVVEFGSVEDLQRIVALMDPQSAN